MGEGGGAGVRGLGIFGAKLDLGVGVDMNDALGRRRDDCQPDLLKRISGRIQHLTKLGRYIAAVDALLAGRGDDVARRHRFHAEAALERSEEHTSELQSLMRRSSAVFCLKQK